ncbi:hypothetical protein D9M72_460780 [compost metagenome]
MRREPRIDAPFESWHVSALGDADDDRIGSPGNEVVAFERPANAAGFDPHRRIRLRVERGIPAEDLGCNRIGLYAISSARNRFLDDIGQEFAITLRRIELGAAANSIELCQNFRVGGWGNCRLDPAVLPTFHGHARSHGHNVRLYPAAL